MFFDVDLFWKCISNLGMNLYPMKNSFDENATTEPFRTRLDENASKANRNKKIKPIFLLKEQRLMEYLILNPRLVMMLMESI